jgi:(E)-4-hydroxy-3-methylbut-2-enyl-diphosphate synthase
MGCVVNGPGESRDADVGLAGGRGKGIIFRKGEVVATVPEDQFLDAVLKEVASILPPAEARLVYPGDGTLGPVSAGRTRKTGIAAATPATATGKVSGKPLTVLPAGTTRDSKNGGAQ